MARDLRFDVPDTLHHVTNRGLEKRDLVRDDQDRQEFVRLLGRVATRHSWRVFAWALLNNHFHLFFRIPTACLSTGMHDLESGYAALFNRRHERNGPLFQGRFHDVVVENESHVWELGRYVHLNPCRAGLAGRPELWRWSSYGHYLDPRGAPKWLDWATVLAQRTLHEAAARTAYKRFVEEGLSGRIANPFDAAIDGWIVGSKEFVERVQTVCLADDELVGPQNVEDVLTVVAERYETLPVVLLRRGRHGNVGREVAILLCRELLNVSAVEIAEAFGLTSSGLSMAVRRAYERMDREPEFARTVMELRERLGAGVRSSQFQFWRQK